MTVYKKNLTSKKKKPLYTIKKIIYVRTKIISKKFFIYKVLFLKFNSHLYLSILRASI